MLARAAVPPFATPNAKPCIIVQICLDDPSNIRNGVAPFKSEAGWLCSVSLPVVLVMFCRSDANKGLRSLC